MEEPEFLMHNIRIFARENQFNRLLLLRLLYDLGSGKRCRIALEFLRAPEWDDYEIVEAAEYLENEELISIEREKTDNFPPNPPYLTITYKGIRRLRKRLNNLNRPRNTFRLRLCRTSMRTLVPFKRA